MKKIQTTFPAIAILALLTFAAAAPAEAGETSTYTYDAQGRLVAVDYAGTVNNGEKHTICYDTADNRIEYKSDSGGSGVTCPPPTAATGSGGSSGPPPLPSISISDAEASEGWDLGFTVSLSNAYTSAISVSYSTATGTAVANDFVASSGTLIFAPGQTVQSVSVHANTDSRVEIAEFMYVNLSSPTGGATISRSQGVGTIDDNTNGGYN